MVIDQEFTESYARANPSYITILTASSKTDGLNPELKNLVYKHI